MRIADDEARAPAHRGDIKWVNLLDAGCSDPTWSGAQSRTRSLTRSSRKTPNDIKRMKRYVRRGRHRMLRRKRVNLFSRTFMKQWESSLAPG